ncbi:putative divalent cation/proton antiporter TMEM165 [Ciona intestinalis]
MRILLMLVLNGVLLFVVPSSCEIQAGDPMMDIKPIRANQLNIVRDMVGDGRWERDVRGDVKDTKLLDSPANAVKSPYSLYNVGFVHAFVKAIMVIIVSEIGDKTFFIAAIFAMKHARSTVFAGAIAALGLMTFLSVVMGYATTIIPRSYTFYGSVILFVIFGAKMLHEGISMSPQGSQEEMEEVQAELKKKDEEIERASEVTQDVETGIIRGGYKVRKLLGVFSPVLIQSFTLTFLAEWGDRSQITTIVLAASEDALGVLVGAVIGHALCTGMAVIGGRMIAQKISVRTVTIIGGVFFIFNAVFSLLTGPSS